MKTKIRVTYPHPNFFLNLDLNQTKPNINPAAQNLFLLFRSKSISYD